MYTYEDLCNETSRAYLAAINTCSEWYDMEIERLEFTHSIEMDEATRRAWHEGYKACLLSSIL